MKKIDKCILCDYSKFTKAFVVPDRHYGIKGEYQLDQCENCGLVFLNPMPSVDELMKFYPEENYYSYHADFLKKNSHLKEILKKLLLLELRTNDPEFDQPGRVLDIGCGNGWVLFKYKNWGWEVFGVEPSKIAAEAGNRHGLNIIHGDLRSSNFESNSFDYVRTNHSFEHIPDPLETLEEIKRILKPGGKLFIGVPNIDSFTARIFKQYWYYLGAPVHTFNYSQSTLSKIVTKAGFSVEKIIYNSNWAGILGSLQVYLNRNSNRPSSSGFVFNFIPFRTFASLLSLFLNSVKKEIALN